MFREHVLIAMTKSQIIRGDPEKLLFFFRVNKRRMLRATGYTRKWV